MTGTALIYRILLRFYPVVIRTAHFCLCMAGRAVMRRRWTLLKLHARGDVRLWTQTIKGMSGEGLQEKSVSAALELSRVWRCWSHVSPEANIISPAICMAACPYFVPDMGRLLLDTMLNAGATEERPGAEMTLYNQPDSLYSGSRRP